MPKRPDGSGTIYERRDCPGTYVGQVVVDGKRRKVSGSSRRDVEQKMRALVRTAARGKLVEGRTVVSDLMRQWRERVLAGRDIAPKTRELTNWALDLS